jgi:hypothetical protein
VCRSEYEAELTPVDAHCDNDGCDVALSRSSQPDSLVFQLRVRGPTVLHVTVDDQDGERWSDDLTLVPGEAPANCPQP